MMKEEKMKVLLVFNPHAASKRAGRLLKPVLEEFKNYNIDVDLRVTRFQNDAVSLIANENLSDYNALVAAGGDGTLFEVVNGLFRRKDKVKIPLGILPIGTGNAFVRDIDLKTGEWKKAIKMIKGLKTKKVDVGCFNTAGEDHFFINILGLGFVADVSKVASKLKWLGNVSYTLGVLWRVLFLRKYPINMQIDDKEINIQNTFIEISNSRYTSNFLMAPDAKIDDGLFDLTILNGITRLKLLQFFPKIFTGEHVHLEEIHTYKARKIKIKTSKPQILAPDGELLGITPIEVKCLPGAIDVICEN